MFDHLLESSHQDDPKKWSNMGFGEEITQVESIEINFTQLIRGPGKSKEADKELLVPFTIRLTSDPDRWP